MKRILCALAVPVMVVLAGCSQDENWLTRVPAEASEPVGDACSTPAEGCACPAEGQEIECGALTHLGEDTVSCSVGKRRCQARRWSACSVEGVQVKPRLGLSPQGLGNNTACITNPCDPYCQTYEDNPDGLDLPDSGEVQEIDGGLTLKGHPATSVGGTCTGIAISPATQEIRITRINSTAGNLTGQYYSDANLGTLSATRQDTQINFDYGSGSPGVGSLGVDNFSIRWSGTITAPTSGTYTFITRTDDGVRLYVDNVLVINKWQSQSATEWSSPTVALTAGVAHSFKMEYYEASGSASAQLLWQTPTLAKQPIPASAFLGSTTGLLATEPSTLQYTVLVEPANCYKGVVTAAWSLDRLDTATVSSQGAFQVFSAVSGPVEVRAYVGDYLATARANVVVDIFEDVIAPPGSSTIFKTGTASGSDTVQVLYPYDNTVLPLGMRAPTVQWDTGGTAASAVKIGLYVSSGFKWEAVVPEGSPARFAIPQDVWKYYEQTAKGGAATWSVQRIVGGTLRPAVTRTLRFGNAPLRGRIYYTEYGRADQHAYVMTADPGGSTTASNAFGSNNGCPVCHSVSANGTVFATADRSWSSQGGLSRIESTGTLTTLSDHPGTATYKAGAQDWRGFSWAGLTPDGSYALGANNIWGNSSQNVVGINTTTRALSVPTTYLSQGNGTGLWGRYFRSTDFSGSPLGRVDPVLNFNWSGIPAPALPADGFSVRWTGQLLPYFSETYTLETESMDGVRLIVNGQTLIDALSYQGATTTRSGSLALVAGQAYDIQVDWVDTAGTAQLGLYWSSPSTPRALIPETQLRPGLTGRGVTTTYYNNADFTGDSAQRWEPDLNSTWGSDEPVAGYGTNWSSVWQTRLEAPLTGTYQLCVDTNVATTTGITYERWTGVTGNAVSAIPVGTTPNYTTTLTTFEAATDAADNYGARARGYLVPSATGKYWFWIASDDNGELWLSTNDTVGAKVRIAYHTSWTGSEEWNKFTTQKSAGIDLVAGNRYYIEALVKEGTGGDNLAVGWRRSNSSPASPTEVIPGANLRPWDSGNAGVTTVVLDGATIISGSNPCSGNLPLTAGSFHDLEARYAVPTAGNAKLRLLWSTSTAPALPQEAVRSEYLWLPTGTVPPTQGILATYYDREDFDLGVPQNATVGGFSRIEPSVNLSWGSTRPNWSKITAADTYSARLTGSLTTPCSGFYEFELTADDGARVWLARNRLFDRWSSTTAATAILYLEGSRNYELKIDTHQSTGSAGVRLRWKTPCGGVWEDIPAAQLSPSGDSGLGGVVRSGGDNGSGTSYWVWQLPQASGVAPTDVTGSSPASWGLGASVLMVPSFAPDASKLVFVDGDSGGGAGWRKGLSVFSFDQGNMRFWDRRLLVNHWPNRDVIKWPTFETDSRSVIFQTSTPTEFCCRNNWTRYGHMAPTNYYEEPGRLWSVDATQAVPQEVELAQINQGERAIDRNKAYQPTMLPVAAAGYRWAVFTSTRPYGNTINLPAIQQDYSNTASFSPMLNYTQVQSQLWVAAIDDSPSGSTDRSHPGFWLPNQNYNEDASKGFINERAFWVLEPCKPAGQGVASLCDVSEDCCGGSGANPTAVCQIDTPVATPPIRHCAARPSTTSCRLTGSTCGTNTDCCSGLVCVNLLCEKPPDLEAYSPGNFERVFELVCPEATKGVWRYFDWQAETPEGTAVEFYAEGASDLAELNLLPSAPTAVNTPGVVHLVTASGNPGPGWTGTDVGTALDNAGLAHLRYLKITMRFVPNAEFTLKPTVFDWRQAYTCPPAE